MMRGDILMEYGKIDKQGDGIVDCVCMVIVTVVTSLRLYLTHLIRTQCTSPVHQPYRSGDDVVRSEHFFMYST